MTRPRIILTNWWLRTGYVLLFAGFGAGLAVVADVPMIPAVGCYVGFALLRVWLNL
jgi:hypothetical protein